MSDASLFIRCDCHSPEHMLIFDVWHWDTEEPKCSQLSVHYGLDPCLSFWKRVRYAVQYVVTGKTGKWWWADTIITNADATALRDFVNDYLAKNLNK